MADQGTPRLFVSYGYSDSQAAVVMTRLSPKFDIFTAISVTGPLESRGALKISMESADGVVAVLPPPGNRDRTNVVFEAGVAVGLGLPVVLVGAGDIKLPRSLQGIPTGDIESAASLDDIIRRALRRGPVDEIVLPSRYTTRDAKRVASSASRGPGLAFRSAIEERTHYSSMTERELVGALEEQLRTGGTEVLVPRPGQDQLTVDLPDLIIWDDDLLPVMGVQLPVEILRSLASFPKVRGRLLRTMRASGATSLLAVAADGIGSRRWSDGRDLILGVTATTLMEALQQRPLAEALANLLEVAEA